MTPIVKLASQSTRQEVCVALDPEQNYAAIFLRREADIPQMAFNGGTVLKADRQPDCCDAGTLPERTLMSTWGKGWLWPEAPLSPTNRPAWTGGVVVCAARLSANEARLSSRHS